MSPNPASTQILTAFERRGADWTTREIAAIQGSIDPALAISTNVSHPRHFVLHAEMSEKQALAALKPLNLGPKEVSVLRMVGYDDPSLPFDVFPSPFLTDSVPVAA